MIVLAHRGFWLRPEERNTLPAFERAFEAGHGVETDVRDHDGELVIAHDPPRGAELTPFSEFLSLYAAAGAPGALAVNIKADGLCGPVCEALEAAGIANAFAFDMSVPDTLPYLRSGLAVFTRQSEYEPLPPFLDQAAGVWIDCFERDWIDASLVRGHLAKGKRVALVSPELHGRPHLEAWASWTPLAGQEDVLLCTDFPKEAGDFFSLKPDEPPTR